MKEELILYMASKGYRYKKTADKIVLRKSKNHIYYTIEIGEYGISSYISRQNALTTKEDIEDINKAFAEVKNDAKELGKILGDEYWSTNRLL